MMPEQCSNDSACDGRKKRAEGTLRKDTLSVRLVKVDTPIIKMLIGMVSPVR